ncbi:hypothetical protein FKM82_025694 [Ascaphus truei]
MSSVPVIYEIIKMISQCAVAFLDLINHWRNGLLTCTRHYVSFIRSLQDNRQHYLFHNSGCCDSCSYSPRFHLYITDILQCREAFKYQIHFFSFCDVTR